MSRPTTAAERLSARTLAAVAEIAADLTGERMRRDEAARVLVLSRRLAGLAAQGAVVAPDAADGASRAVREIGRHWDPAVMTASEYVEMLPTVVVDRLLRAAPAWAAQVTAPAYRRAA